MGAAGRRKGMHRITDRPQHHLNREEEEEEGRRLF